LASTWVGQFEIDLFPGKTGSMDMFEGNYSADKADALKAHPFDRPALGWRGQSYERLDQPVELLLGVC
jgi:xylose isomerase